MRKTKRIFIIGCLLALVNCKSTWINTNEKTAEKIKDKSVLIDQIEQIKRKNHFMKSKLYKYGDFKVLKTEFFSDTLMRTKSETYLKGSLLLKKTIIGIVAVSPPMDKQSPYAKVFEEVYYFNSKKNGILKERKVEIKNFGEYKNAKSKLSEMKYETKEISQKDYIKIKEEYEQMIDLYKKY